MIKIESYFGTYEIIIHHGDFQEDGSVCLSKTRSWSEIMAIGYKSRLPTPRCVCKLSLNKVTNI